MVPHLAPSPQLLKLTAHLFRHLSEQKTAVSDACTKALEAELSQIEQLLDLLIEVNHTTDLSLLKKGMREREQKKVVLEDQIVRITDLPLHPLTNVFESTWI